ncbi:hypothetical protein AB0F88_31395 [Streptosporangium sp. NPDC023963]|uniref:hypothetical protein n=1 Tax=Streptosporangium sp. NPDC023963 TaxID=3155608 RepID=UPI003443F65C
MKSAISYESAARSSEALGLDVEELDLRDRRVRVELPPADVDAGSGKARLSYRRAAELFESATGGWTLHQLRHSALTRAAEDGAKPQNEQHVRSRSDDRGHGEQRKQMLATGSSYM